MIDMALNIHLDYLRCFAVVKEGYSGLFDICQTDYNIHAKLNFSPYSEVIAKKRLTNVKEKW